MAAQPFIYREAAPGNQAVQYAQMQANADIERERMLDSMYQNILRNATTQGANMGNMALTRSQMDRDAARDVQRKSEFDQSMNLERERLAATNQYQKDRTAAIQAEKDAEYDRQYEAFARLAKNENDLGYVPGLGRKLPSGLIYDPALKKVVPLMQPRVVATPPGIGTHMDSIDALRNRVRSTVGVSPVPSPGFTPRETDFRVGEPAPEYNIRSSELLGPRTIPMDDYQPQSYDEAVYLNGPRFAVPEDVFLPSDEPPRRRLPGAFLPY